MCRRWPTGLQRPAKACKGLEAGRLARVERDFVAGPAVHPVVASFGDHGAAGATDTDVSGLVVGRRAQPRAHHVVGVWLHIEVLVEVVPASAGADPTVVGTRVRDRVVVVHAARASSVPRRVDRRGALPLEVAVPQKVGRGNPSICGQREVHEVGVVGLPLAHREVEVRAAGPGVNEAAIEARLVGGGDGHLGCAPGSGRRWR